MCIFSYTKLVPGSLYIYVAPSSPRHKHEFVEQGKWNTSTKCGRTDHFHHALAGEYFGEHLFFPNLVHTQM